MKLPEVTPNGNSARVIYDGDSISEIAFASRRTALVMVGRRLKSGNRQRRVDLSIDRSAVLGVILQTKVQRPDVSNWPAGSWNYLSEAFAKQPHKIAQLSVVIVIPFAHRVVGERIIA